MSPRRFGNIRQLPGGRFQARWTGPDGHQHKGPDTFATHALAEKWLASVRVDRDRGRWVDERHGQVTFAEVAEQWQATIVHLRPSSLARDVGYLERYVLPAFGPRPVGAITASDVAAWVAELRARPLAPATVRDAARVCRAVFDVAVRDKRRLDNPARGVKLPRIEREEMQILTPDQIALLAATIDPRYRNLILVGCHTGLRPGELVALTPADVDPLRRRLVVARNVVEVSGQLHHSHVKTTAGRRAVPLSAVATQALTELMAGRHRDDLLFTAPHGGYLRLSTWRSKFWRPAVCAIGLPSLRIHDMRHTAISLWMAAGVDPKAIATWAGHRSIVTVLDRYGHLQPDHADQFIARLDALVAAASPAPAGLLHPIGDPSGA